MSHLDNFIITITTCFPIFDYFLIQDINLLLNFFIYILDRSLDTYQNKMTSYCFSFYLSMIYNIVRGINYGSLVSSKKIRRFCNSVDYSGGLLDL